MEQENRNNTIKEENEQEHLLYPQNKMQDFPQVKPHFCTFRMSDNKR